MDKVELLGISRVTAERGKQRKDFGNHGEIGSMGEYSTNCPVFHALVKVFPHSDRECSSSGYRALEDAVIQRVSIRKDIFVM